MKRLKLFLTHFAAVLVGAIAGAVIITEIRGSVARSVAVMKCDSAIESMNAGDEDKAIILLSQASERDRDAYLPWELLAQIYMRRDKKQLALEMYKKALDLLNQKEDFLLPPREHSNEIKLIQGKIDVLQKQADGQ